MRTRKEANAISLVFKRRAFQAMKLITFLASSGLTQEALNGEVISRQGTPVIGVSVSLANAKLSATTDSSGKWQINAYTTAIQRSQDSRKHYEGLWLDPNRGFIVRLNQHAINGQRHDYLSKQSKSIIAASRSNDIQQRVDTLIYTYSGRVFLRDTISSIPPAPIRRIYDTAWVSTFVYGWVIDTRDSIMYRSIQIGQQIWMAENLNYSATKSLMREDSGKIYGRIYPWAFAMALPDSCNKNACGPLISTKHRGICPEGWRVPNDIDWNTLASATGGTSAGLNLKSKFGWINSGNGSDIFGFRVLPTGYAYGLDSRDRYYVNTQYATSFASSSEASFEYQWERLFSAVDKKITRQLSNKTYLTSVRCIKNGS